MKRNILVLSFLLSLTSCADLNSGGYPNQYPPTYPNGGYPSGNYPANYPPPSYPPGGYGYPNSYPPPPPPPVYDCRVYGNCPGTYYPPNNNGWNKPPRHDHHDNKPSSPPIPPPVVVRPPTTSSGTSITPSCPAGTVFTGRTCKITDSKLRKPGGDGNINPCPKGMWVSNGTCVGK